MTLGMAEYKKLKIAKNIVKGAVEMVRFYSIAITLCP